MKFSAFKCECGYKCITPEDDPRCKDCGKHMISMDTESDDYKQFDSDVKKRLGL